MNSQRGGFQAFSSVSWKTLQPWESLFDEQIAGIEDELIRIRRHLHAHPEPSGEEVETSRFLAERLSAAGIKSRVCRDGVGVIADAEIGTPQEGCPRIAIRADIDALRLTDEKDVDYASQNAGIAHACGHDAHASIVLGAALAGAALTESATGNEQNASTSGFGTRLRFIFQPAEESCVGAQWMVEQGAVDDVDAILGLHVDPERAVGQVGIRFGTLTANCDEVSITIEGHGGHAARPHHSVDPIMAAAHLISTLYKFLPRSIDSRSPAVFTIGQISGGDAPNVIPGRVELSGSLRTTDADSRQVLKERILEICDGVGRNSGTTIHTEFVRPLQAVQNHPAITAALEEASRRVLGPENTATINHPSMGGEDFSVYLEHVPGALLRLGCAVPGSDETFLHSPLFDIDERTLALGTRILVRTALLLSAPANE